MGDEDKIIASSAYSLFDCFEREVELDRQKRLEKERFNKESKDEGIILNWIDPYKTTPSPVIDKIIDHLISDMKQTKKYSVPTQQKNLNNLKDHIRVVLCNLIASFHQDPKVWIGFELDKNAYQFDPAKKDEFQFTYTHVKKTTDFLTDNGYILLVKENGDLICKMRCKPKLTQLFE